MNIFSLYLVCFQMTELARSQITGAAGATTAATHSSLLDKQDRHESSHSKHQHALSPLER